MSSLPTRVTHPTHRTRPGPHGTGPGLRRTLAAGLAGAVALGGVLVGGAVTSSADAAKTKTWERLAQCESGKRWHVHTGNGYYGGLQFSRSTWNAYHGRHFAKRPDRARKKEQIAVAERLINHQGWSAWPSCSDRLHLSKKQAKAAWDVGTWKHKDGFHFRAGKHRPHA